MRLDGTRDLAAPREAVFDALVDPHVVASALPGGARLDVRDADRWTVEVAVPLLPRAPRLRFDVSVVERERPERARLEAAAKTLGSSVRIDTGFHLGEAGAGTSMRYEADVGLGGLLGRLPRSAVEPVAQRVVDRLVGAVERRTRAA